MLRIKVTSTWFIRMLLAVMLIALGGDVVKGQAGCPLPKVRRYANVQRDFQQGLLTSITTPAAAADGNPKTSSTLTVPVGLLNINQVYQYLEFSNSTNIPANTPVTIKLSLPNSVLGVLDNINIQPFTGLEYDPGLLGIGARWKANPVGSPFNSASLLNVINGVGNMEFTITPNVPYQGVWINLGSILGVVVKADIFDAYIFEDAGSTNTCNDAIDVLSGVKATTIGGILNSTGSVLNPWSAIDNDPNLLTYSEINVGIQVLSQVYHTTIFKTASQPGDAIKMVIQKPSGGLLDLNVLNGFSIQLYNKETAVGTPIEVSSGLLSLSLLPNSPTGNEKYTLLMSVPMSSGAYDRIEVKMGGVAGVSLVPGLRIYDVKRVIYPITQIGGESVTKKTICLNETTTLSVSNPQSCTQYTWFKKTGSTYNQVGTGTSFSPSILSLTQGDHFFSVQASRTNCTETSEMIADTITVAPRPSAPTVTPTALTVCNGSLAPMMVTSTPEADVIYNWYTVPTGGTIVGTGTIFNPVITATTSYYVEAYNTKTKCTSTSRTRVNVTMAPVPNTPDVQLSTVSICNGDNATLSVKDPEAGLTYNWYTVSTGGTPVGSGVIFTTNVTVNTVFYVEANTGTCSSTVRKSVSVIVNPLPPTPGVTLSNLSICTGSTANMAISSPVAGITYKWYSVATGGTPEGTGNTYSPIVNANKVYYVEAYNNLTTCTSQSRATVNITVKELPTATITGTITTCLNSASPNITFTGSLSTTPYIFVYQINGGTPISVKTDPGNTSVIVPAPTNVATTLTYTLVSVQSETTNCTQLINQTAVVTIKPLPTINLGTNPNMCQGVSTVLLPYLSLTEAPTSYNITWNTAATTAGFQSSNGTLSLPAGNITLPIPTTISAITYKGFISVKNGNNCESIPIPFDIIVHPKPTTLHIVTQ